MGARVNIVDRWAKRRLEQGGYLRSYSPSPSAVLGIGMIDWPGDSEDDPELYLKYARTSNVVYSCASIRANMLSGLPLRAYKLGADAKAGRVLSVREPRERMGMPLEVRGRRMVDATDVTEVEGGKLVDLLRHVNRWWTPRRLVHTTEMSLCLAGQAYWQLDRGENNSRAPSDIYYLKHTRVAPVKHPTEIIDGWTLDPHTRQQQRLSVDEAVWFRFADPADPDYGALPPLAAARLGADTYAAAMKSNWSIFANGLAPGGFVMPPEGQSWAEDQLDEAQEAWTRKLSGPDKRHRWLFMPEAYTVKENTLTPRDAEFLGGLDFSVEDVARAYGLPIELVGGARRTYQNLENAMRAVWMFTLEPEASFIAAELTEQLVPQFGGEVDFVAFDLADVTALQEDEALRWSRAKDQLTAGALTINEWRADEGLEPVAWGDVAWMPAGAQPITDGEPRAVEAPFGLGKVETAVTAATGGTDGVGRGARLIASPADDAPVFGSPEHERLWTREMELQRPHEERMVVLMDGLFDRQRESLVAQMGGRAARMSLDDIRRMFNMGRWVREFRTAIRPHLSDIIRESGDTLFGQLPGGDVFDPNAPAVVRAQLRQAHEFASTINQETWARLNQTLAEGISGGDGLRDLMGRVESTLNGFKSSAPPLTWEGGARQSRAEMIARTETTRSWSNGAHEAAMQSDAVKGKRWMAAMDARTRESHQMAHNMEVAKDKPFVVGGEECDFPGDSRLSAGNVINCRCTVSYLTREPKADVPVGGPVDPGYSDVYGAPLDDADIDAIVGRLAAVPSVEDNPELVALDKQVSAKWREIERETDRDRMAQLASEYDTLSRAASDRRLDLLDAHDNAVRTILQELRVSDPVDVTMSVAPGVPSFVQGKAETALRHAQQYISADRFPEGIPALSLYWEQAGRSRYSSSLGRLTITGESGTPDVDMVHELGHVLEHAVTRGSWTPTSVTEWLRRRTADSPVQRLVDLVPGVGYDESELTRPDDFVSPYVGRIYGPMEDYGGARGSSEVISMGLQWFMTRPVEFARRDPDHFRFLVRWMRGR